MVYLSIDDKTPEGKRLLESIRKSNAVTIHSRPNEMTRQALRDAKTGKVKTVENVDAWLKKLAG